MGLDYFEKAYYNFEVAERLLHKTFYLLGDNKVIMQVMKVLARGVDNLVKGCLVLDAEKGVVRLSKNPGKNYRLFKNKVGKNYFSEKEIDSMDFVLRVVAKHRDSPIEFVKKEKFIFLVGGKYEILTTSMLLGIVDGVRPAFLRARNQI